MHSGEQIGRKLSSEDVVVFSFLSAVPLWTYVFLPLLFPSWTNSTSEEEHVMSAGNWTDIATASGAIIAAGAAVYAAYLAKQASDKTYQVARRYSQSELLPDDRPRAFDKLLEQLRVPCNNYDPAHSVSDNVRKLVDGEINRLTEDTKNALRLGKF